MANITTNFHTKMEYLYIEPKHCYNFDCYDLVISIQDNTLSTHLATTPNGLTFIPTLPQILSYYFVINASMVHYNHQIFSITIS